MENLMRSQIESSFEAFEALENNNSNLAKLSILSEQNFNPVFNSLLEATYNPFKVYHIKKVPDIDMSGIGYTKENNYTFFLHLLDNLKDRVVTGHEAIEFVRRVFISMSQIERKWYWRVLTKDLNVGIQAKTINKAIPGLIPVFDVMLAQPFRSYPKEFILQPKFDGMRLLGSTTDGLLRSRNGKVIEGFDLIEEELRSLPSGYLIDGELLSGAKGKKDFNRLMTQAFRKSSGKQGVLYAFDIISEEEFNGRALLSPQAHRLLELDTMLKTHTQFNIKEVTRSVVMKADNIEPLVIEKIYNDCLDQGYEGLIVKDLWAPYQLKRSYAWQKIKPIETYDLKVIGIEPGEPGTKYEDLLGRLVVDFNGVEVRVGSGLSDDQRQLWWEEPDRVLGKTIEIECQETTTNKQETISLRFPRFKRLRQDKE